MTVSDDSVPLSGEDRLHNRRMAFFRYVMTVTGIFAVIGFVTAIVARSEMLQSLPAGLVVAALVMTIAGFAWFTRDYFHRIDELDLLDNLWASLIAFYGYIVALPCWFALHYIGLAPPPEQWTIWAASLLIGVAAYIARKAGWR